MRVCHHTFRGEQVQKVPCMECARFFNSFNVYGGKIPDSDVQVVTLEIKQDAWSGKCGTSRQWYGEGVCTRCATTHIVPLRMSGDFYDLIECARMNDKTEDNQ